MNERLGVLRIPRRTKDKLKSKAALEGIPLTKYADKILRSQFKEDGETNFGINKPKKVRRSLDVV